MGPVTSEELSSRVDAGVLQSGTPVQQGEAGPWQPYAENVAEGVREQSTPPPLPLVFRCSRCSNHFGHHDLVQFQEQRFCLACKTDYLQHLAQGSHSPPGTPFLFLRRSMAKFIDVNMGFMLLLSILVSLSDVESAPALEAGFCLTMFFAYLSLLVFSTSRLGGTPGKLVFQLVVVDTGGASLGYTHALSRIMAECVSMTCLGMGYLMALADVERRTLHDRICQTRVVPRSEVSI